MTKRPTEKFLYYKAHENEAAVCYSTFKQRVSRLNMDYQEALTKPKNFNRKRKARSEVMKYYEENLDRAAVGRNTYRVRVKNGWNRNEALVTPLLKNGEIKKYYEENIERAQVSLSCFRQRLNKNMDKEEALTTPPVFEVKKRPENFDEYAEKARKNGIERKTFIRRFYNGWALEEAAGIKFRDKRKMKDPRVHKQFDYSNWGKKVDI